MMSERNAYIGPRPFSKQESDLFFGRTYESRELLNLVMGFPIVLLYGLSGTGKSSLTYAGLLPKIDQKRYEVFVVSRLQGPTIGYSGQSEIENIYAYNAISCLDANAKVTQSNRTLAEFFTALPHLPDERGDSCPRILIFDQFEELFTLYPDRWRNREPFLRQVNELVEENLVSRILLVMREEFIAQLDPYHLIFSNGLRNRLRVEQLRKKPALEAITQPVVKWGIEYDDSAAEQLVSELLTIRVESQPGRVVEVEGEFVEPVQLQIVCQKVWETVFSSKTRTITQKDLAAIGNSSRALVDYYEQVVREITRSYGIDQKALRDWFEGILLTAAGTRGIVYQDREKTGGLPNEVVKYLESRHLVRTVFRAGSKWYELSHDRFVEPIKVSNHKWLTHNLPTMYRPCHILVSPEDSRILVDGKTAHIVTTNELFERLQSELWAIFMRLSQEVEDTGNHLRRMQHNYWKQFERIGIKTYRRFLPEPAREIIEKAVQQTRGREPILTIESGKSFVLPWEVFPTQSPPKKSESLWGCRHSTAHAFLEIATPEFVNLGADYFVSVEPSNSLQSYRNVWDTAYERVRDRRQNVAYRLNLLPKFDHFVGGSSLDSIWGSFSILHCEWFEDYEKFYSDTGFAKNLVEFLQNSRSLTRPLLYVNNGLDYETQIQLAFDLLQAGAGGVIIPSCNLPENFARAFADEFYLRLLTTLLSDFVAYPCEVIKNCRQYFASRYDNPLGLAYSYFGSANLLVRIND